MTDFCHSCGKPKKDSRLPILIGFTVLTVLCCAGWAFSGLLAWEIGRVREELSRRPSATFLSLPGHYPTVTVYREGWDVKEGAREDPLSKPNNKKGVK